MVPDQRASTGGPASVQTGIGGPGGPTSVTAMRMCATISDLLYSGRETMNDLDDKRPIERTGEGPGVREAKPGERLRGVPRVPHQEDIVPDHGDPVEPHIEVDALALVIVLDEREQAGAGVEVVLEPVRRQHRRERPHGQLSRRSREIRAQDDVAAAAPRRGELEIGAVTAVELAPVHECTEAQRPPRVHEILQLVAGPPVAAGLD